MARKNKRKRENDEAKVAEKESRKQALEKLKLLGYSAAQAKQALKSSYHDFDIALDLLSKVQPKSKKSKKSSKKQKSSSSSNANGVIDLSNDAHSGGPNSSSSSSSSSVQRAIAVAPNFSSSSSNGKQEIDLSGDSMDISPSKSLKDVYREREKEENKKFEKKKAVEEEKRAKIHDKVAATQNVLKHLERGSDRLKVIIDNMPHIDHQDDNITKEDLKKHISWFQRALYDELGKQKRINDSMRDEIMVQEAYEGQIDGQLRKMELTFEDEKLARQLQQEQQDSGTRMSLADRNILMLKEKYEFKKKYSCSICLDDDLNINNILVLSCSHFWCMNCLKRTFEGRINEGLIGDSLTCPNPDCDTLVSYDEIRLSVDASVFEKYERFLLEDNLKKDPDCRWCPSAGCETAMLGMPGAKMMRCPKCDARFCFVCKTNEYHDGVTCEAFQQWQKENGSGESKFSEWAQKNSKICPRCKVRIEKNGGCDHMTCRGCKYEFYWSSGKPYGKFAPNFGRGRGRGRGRGGRGRGGGGRGGFVWSVQNVVDVFRGV